MDYEKLNDEFKNLKRQTDYEIKKLKKKRSDDINVDNFHGDFVKLPEFLTQYKIAAEANDWSERDKCKKFPVYLRGLALEAYQNIPEHDRNDWDKVEQAFKDNILTDDVTMLYSRKFKTRKQNPDETIAEYAYELKKLAKRAFPDLQDEQLDCYLMDQFLDGVHPDMQQILLDKDYKTYFELMKKAQAIEYRRELMTMHHKNTFSVNKNEINDDKNKMNSFDKNKDFKQYKEKIDEKMNYYCENCKKFGHLTTACRRLVSIRTPNNYINNRKNENGYYKNNYYNNVNKSDQYNRGAYHFNRGNNNFNKRMNYNNFRNNQYQQNKINYENNGQRAFSPYRQDGYMNFKNNSYYRNNNYRSNSPYRENNFRNNNYKNNNWNKNPNFRNNSPNRGVTFYNKNRQNNEYRNKSPIRTVTFENEKSLNDDNRKNVINNYIAQLEEELDSMNVLNNREYNENNRKYYENNGVYINNASRINSPFNRMEKIIMNCFAIIKNDKIKLKEAENEILNLKKENDIKENDIKEVNINKFDFSQQFNDNEITKVNPKEIKNKANNAKVNKNNYFQLNFTTIICLFLIFMTLQIKTTDAIRAFDCSKPEFGNEYSLFDVEQCPEASPTRLVQSEETYSIYQETTIVTVTVVECKLRSAELILYCGHLSHSSIVKTQVLDITQELTEEQCRDAGYIGQIKLSPDTTIKVQINTTTRQNIMIKGTVDRQGSCTGESYKIDGQITKNIVVSREYEITVTKYSANFDSQTGVMLTNGYSMCQLEHSSCRTGFSTLVYKYTAPICQLIFLKTVSLLELQGKQSNFMSSEKFSPSGYESFANNTKFEKIPETDTPLVLMSRDDDVLRFIRKESKIKCNKKVYITNYDNIYVSKHRIADAQMNIKPVDLRQYYYFNNKIDYVYHKLLNSLETIYHETVKRDCLIHREVLRTKLTIAISNPDIATPLLSAEIGLFARTVGEVLYTFKCKSVLVTLRQEPDRCTNELPVIFQNQNVYLEPVTRMITKNPTVIKCTRALSPKFQINGKVWISLPEQKPVTVPLTLELPKITELLQFNDIQNLAKKGLYTNAALEEASKYILFPRERARIMTVIARQSTRDLQNSPDFELLLSPEHFKKATANYLKMIWGKFIFFGQIFSGFMGVYIIGTALKMLIQRLLSTYTLYKIFGVTWKLTLGCCPFLSKLLLIKHCHKIVTSYNNKPDNYFGPNNIDEDERRTMNSLDSQDILKENLITEIKKRNAETQSCSDFCLETKVKPPIKPKPRLKPNAPTTNINNDNEANEKLLYPQLNCYALYTVNNKTPIIHVRVNGIVMDALIDTGASISLLNTKHVNLQKDNLKNTDISPTSASGHNIQVYGMKECCIELFDERIFITIPVASSIHVGIILGMDFLSKLNNKYVDLKTGMLINIDRDELKEDKEVNETNLKIISIFKPNASPIVVHVNRCRPAPPENIQFQEIENKNIPITVNKPYDLRPRVQSLFKNVKNYISKRIHLIMSSDKTEDRSDKINFCNYYINTLVDTGSPISIISIGFLTEQQIKQLQISNKSYKTITGENLEIKGFKKFTVILKNSKEIIHSFAIIAIKLDYIIIGRDMIETMNNNQIDILNENKSKKDFIKIKDIEENNISEKEILENNKQKIENKSHVYKSYNSVYGNILLLLIIILSQIEGVKTSAIINETINDIKPLVVLAKPATLLEHWRTCCLYCINYRKCHKNCKNYSYEQYMMVTYITQRIKHSLTCLKICYKSPLTTTTNIVESILNNEQRIKTYTELATKIAILALICTIIMITILIPFLYWRKRKNSLKMLKDKYKKPPGYVATCYSFSNDFLNTDLSYFKNVRLSQQSVTENSVFNRYINDNSLDKLQFSTFKEQYKPSILDVEYETSTESYDYQNSAKNEYRPPLTRDDVV